MVFIGGVWYFNKMEAVDINEDFDLLPGYYTILAVTSVCGKYWYAELNNTNYKPGDLMRTPIPIEQYQLSEVWDSLRVAILQDEVKPPAYGFRPSAKQKCLCPKSEILLNGCRGAINGQCPTIEKLEIQHEI